jgi:uncharacterized membrane protein/predicted DsbA family dithiol-disulfide isomerase
MRGTEKTGVIALLASLVPVLAALVASAALAVDYLQPAPVFCSEAGGCEAVRQTAFAAVFGVPTPVIGLAGFLVLGVAVLLPGRRARVAQAGLGVVAALAGALFLAAQWALGHFCPYCCVVDASAIASGFVGVWRLVGGAGEAGAAPPRRLVYAGAGAILGALIVPFGVGWWLGVRVPGAIVAEQKRTPAGQITVVDFVDFECPFCRMTNAALEPILEAHRGRVRLVRKQVPLRMHPHALDAARAACCAERLGKGEAMANALFSAPVDDLTPEGCEKIALSVGLFAGPYQACIADPKTDQRIESDRATFKASRGYALPTLWVGDRQLIGAQSGPELEGAIGAALAAAGG